MRRRRRRRRRTVLRLKLRSDHAFTELAAGRAIITDDITSQRAILLEMTTLWTTGIANTAV